MNKRLLILFLTFCFFSFLIKGTISIGGVQVKLPVDGHVYAQGQPETVVQSSSSGTVKDDETVTLTTVMAVILIIWFGIALYLYHIDRKLSKIEKELHPENT